MASLSDATQNGIQTVAIFNLKVFLAHLTAKREALKLGVQENTPRFPAEGDAGLELQAASCLPVFSSDFSFLVWSRPAPQRAWTRRTNCSNEQRR